MRTITAIVITAVLLLTPWGQHGATLTDNSVATVQDQAALPPEIDSPTQETAANTPITRQEALSVALVHANVTEDQIRDLETDLDWEQGKRIWEVDFDHEGTEFEYDIDAYTGEILKSRTQPPKQAAPAEQPTTSKTTITTQTEKKLTRDEAKAIALKHAGVSTVYDLDVELDKEKGILVWEVDFEVSGMEYEYEIDAYSGKILRFHKERD